MNHVEAVPSRIRPKFLRKEPQSCFLKSAFSAFMSAPRNWAALFASWTSPLATRAYLGVSGTVLLRYITRAAGIAPTPAMTLQATSGGKARAAPIPTATATTDPIPWLAKTRATSLPLSLTFAYSLMMTEDTG